jgi:flagellar biosynthesis repressor protein FlbT
MSKSIQLSLKAGERIFINGAVIRVHRKTTIELLNDAVFLLESHVMQVDETTTPLRQLYFVAQTILMDPKNAAETRTLFGHLLGRAVVAFQGPVRTTLESVGTLVEGDRPFDALKILRGLFPVEDAIVAGRALSAQAA